MVSFGEGGFPPLAGIFRRGRGDLAVEDGDLRVGGVSVSEGITLINKCSYLWRGLGGEIFSVAGWDGMFGGS